MRPRDVTDDRPDLSCFLVVVPARDEELEVAACLDGIAAAADRVELPVVVSVVLHRCTDRTAEKVADITRTHPGVHWVTVTSDAGSLGRARAAGVAAGRAHDTLTDLAPETVWLASTDADSVVPPGWLTEQRTFADRGLDLVLGTVEPRDDGSEAGRLWHAQHHLAEGHLGIHGANLGLRLTAYDHTGGFSDLDDGEDVQLVHAVRDVAGLPWTSTDRTRVITSARRQGRAGKGFAGFLRRLDDAVATFGATAELEDRLRTELLRIAEERGPEKTLCPSEAAGAVDPERRQALTPVACAVASALADEGRLVVTQKGVPVDGRTASGPVRVGAGAGRRKPVDTANAGCSNLQPWPTCHRRGRMAAMVTMPVSRPLTFEDFEAIRDVADNGHRYELVDGALIVTPAPSWLHQVASSQLMAALLQTNPDPDNLVVLHAPFDVVLGADSAVQPDLMVFDSRHHEPRTPLLAVEILSPSTRHIDIGLKWSRYASAGIPTYWVVDPDEPAVVGWQLRDGSYARLAAGSAGDEVTLPGPWPVTLTPQSLIRAARPAE